MISIRIVKYFNYLGLSLLIVFITSCMNDEEIFHGEYEFIAQYSATVTVGGFVGLTERTFEIGEKYNGTDEREDAITLRIASHSDLNEDCPNSWCYQEYLVVPKRFLRLVK
jgi:hypothetical protein